MYETKLEKLSIHVVPLFLVNCVELDRFLFFSLFFSVRPIFQSKIQ